MTIGETIRTYRNKAELTQEQLGKSIGLLSAYRQRISDWEVGTRTPSADYLLKLMAALNIPPSAFDEYKGAQK